MMDIKKTIEDAVKKISSDEELKKKFMENPVTALEELLGIDLPDEQINQIITGIKAKLSLDKASDLLGTVSNLGGLFGKK